VLIWNAFWVEKSSGLRRDLARFCVLRASRLPTLWLVNRRDDYQSHRLQPALHICSSSAEQSLHPSFDLGNGAGGVLTEELAGNPLLLKECSNCRPRDLHRLDGVSHVTEPCRNVTPCTASDPRSCPSCTSTVSPIKDIISPWRQWSKIRMRQQRGSMLCGRGKEVLCGCCSMILGCLSECRTSTPRPRRHTPKETSRRHNSRNQASRNT